MNCKLKVSTYHVLRKIKTLTFQPLRLFQKGHSVHFIINVLLLRMLLMTNINWMNTKKFCWMYIMYLLTLHIYFNYLVNKPQIEFSVNDIFFINLNDFQ